MPVHDIRWWSCRGILIDDVKSKLSFNTKGNRSYQSRTIPTEPFLSQGTLLEIIEIARRDHLADRNSRPHGNGWICVLRLWRAWHQVSSVSAWMVCQNLTVSQVFSVGWMVLSGPKTHVKGYIEGLNMLSTCAFAQRFWPSRLYKLGGHQSVDELLLPGGRIYEQRNFYL